MSATNGTWTHFSGTFNSGSQSTISLAITDSNLDGGAGNDFAVDDISVAAVPVPEPGTAVIFLSAAVLALLRRRRESFTV